MNDHILALDPSSAAQLQADWYRLHLMLYSAIGDRVQGEGAEQATNWIFGVDPRSIIRNPAEAPRYILVRAKSELDEKLSGISAHSEKAYSPSAGETVRFYLNVSSQKGRTFDFQKAALLVKPTDGGQSRRDAVYEAIGREFVESAGLTLHGDLEGPFHRTFSFVKGRGRTTQKRSLFVSGVATVSDVAKAAKAIELGIGRDRGLGFGILILEPTGTQ